MESQNLINRREALRRTSIIMGGALSSSVVAGILAGCQTEEMAGWQPEFLSKDQADLVSALTQRILPATDQPGAKEAKVDQFVDMMLKEFYSEPEKQLFVKGLTAIGKEAQSSFDHSFTDCDADQQDQILTKSAQQAKIQLQQTEPASSKKPFFVMIKELTLVGFFTSEIGASQVINYDPVPGGFDGCVPLEQPGKNWAWVNDWADRHTL